MAKTILVVDDDPTQRRLLQAVLERESYAVVHAESAVEAIDRLTKGGGADVVLLDMVMPGMSGPELLQGLRAMDGDIRGLLSTGYDLADQVEHLFAQGFHGFIQKPFTLHTISLKLREILDKTAEPSLFRCQIP